MDKTNGQYSETNDVINEGELFCPALFLRRGKLFIPKGRLYVALEVRFMDVLKKGRPPFRKIFNFNYLNIRKPIPIISDNDFRVITNFLIDEGVWNKN